MGYGRLWVKRGMGYKGFDCTKSLERLSYLKETHSHVIVSGIESNGTNAVWTLASYISFKVRRERV